MALGIDEVSRRWRPLTAQEIDVGYNLLGDAEAKIAARFPGLAAAITAGTVDRVLYASVAASMVIRVLRNPGGYLSQTIADWSGTRDAENARAQVYLADDEATLLSEALGLGSTEAFTIRTSYTPDDTLSDEFA